MNVEAELEHMRELHGNAAGDLLLALEAHNDVRGIELLDEMSRLEHMAICTDRAPESGGLPAFSRLILKGY